MKFVVVGVVAVVALVAVVWAASLGGARGPRNDGLPGLGGSETPGLGGAETPGPGAVETPEPASADDQIRAGTQVIARACSDYAGAFGHGPTVDEVGPDGGVADYADAWPTNPFTDDPMVQSSSPGDFQFNTAVRMPNGAYVGYVNGILSSGQTYTVEFRY